MKIEKRQHLMVKLEDCDSAVKYMEDVYFTEELCKKLETLVLLYQSSAADLYYLSCNTSVPDEPIPGESIFVREFPTAGWILMEIPKPNRSYKILELISEQKTYLVIAPHIVMVYERLSGVKPSHHIEVIDATKSVPKKSEVVFWWRIADLKIAFVKKTMEVQHEGV